MAGWIIPALTAASTIGGALFGTKKKKVKQEPMQTQTQKDAISKLMSYATTGSHDGYKAGEAYTGSRGNFNLSDIEQTGQNKVRSLLSAAGPEGVELGMKEYRDLLATDKYDPYNEKGVYSGFKKGVLREEAEATDRLKRDMSVIGGLYSGATAKEAGLLKERSQDLLTNKLAGLYSDYADRRLTGAGKAVETGVTQENIDLSRIAAAHEYGKIERELETEKATKQYEDWLRARKEKLGQVDALAKVAYNQTPYGAKEVSYTAESPYLKVLNAALGFGTEYYKNKAA